MSESNGNADTTDVRRQQLGTVYAKGLLGAIASSPDPRAILDEFRAIIEEVLTKHPALQSIFGSLRVSPQDKAGIIDRVFGGRVHPDLVKFLHVVGDHGRLDCLRDIYRAARRLFNEAQGIVEVQLTTANPLDDALRDRIRSALAANLQRDVELITRVDSRLIGGMIVRVGDKVYDASVVQQLAAMRKSAVEKAVQQMKDSADRFVVSAG